MISNLPITRLRDELRRIDGALRKFPPEDAPIGMEGAIPVWDPASHEMEYGAPQRAGDDLESEDEERDASELEPYFEIGADVDDERPLIGSEDNELVRQSVLIKGVDALGYYMSFHYTGAQWGIYISLMGLRHLAFDVFKDLPTDNETRLRLAFRAIHRHELGHYSADIMAARWEGLLLRPCYLARKEHIRKDREYDPDEERMCNAYMLRAMAHAPKSISVKGKLEALRQWTKLQPEGYRDGWRVTRRHDFVKDIRTLAHAYRECMPVDFDQMATGGSSDCVKAEDFYPLLPRLDWSPVPLHFIHDDTRHDLRPLVADLFPFVRHIRETEHFARQLSKLDGRIARSWSKTKELLATSSQVRGLGFKPWRPRGRDWYSVRVDKGNRAHLRYDRSQQVWYAEEVGSHKKMGHG